RVRPPRPAGRTVRSVRPALLACGGEHAADRGGEPLPGGALPGEGLTAGGGEAVGAPAAAADGAPLAGQVAHAFQEHGPARGGGRLALSAAVAALPAAVCLAAVAPSLAASAAPPETLSVLALVVLPFTPVLIGAQVWVWRTFGPRTRIGDGPTARIPSFF